MATGEDRDLESLVARSREGERDALDALVEAIQPGVYKLAQRFLMSPADAEDATQEILLKIVTRLGQFDGRSRFTTWTYAVAANHLRDLKRRPQEQALSLEAFAEDLAQGLSDSPYQGPDAAMLLEEVRIGCTLAMLQCLEREARLAYILGEILELEHREAAAVLGIGADAYRKRLSRARGAVTAFLRRHCGLVEPGNACRCSRRVARARDLGRIDPQARVFAGSRQLAQRFPEVLAEIRRLDGAQRAAALFRAQGQPEASPAFLSWLRRTLDRQARRRTKPQGNG